MEPQAQDGRLSMECVNCVYRVDVACEHCSCCLQRRIWPLARKCRAQILPCGDAVSRSSTSLQAGRN